MCPTLEPVVVPLRWFVPRPARVGSTTARVVHTDVPMATVMLVPSVAIAVMEPSLSAVCPPEAETPGLTWSSVTTDVAAPVTVTVAWVAPTVLPVAASVTRTRTTTVWRPATQAVRQPLLLVEAVDCVTQALNVVPAGTLRLVTPRVTYT